MTTLVIDLSDEFIAVANGDDYYLSTISSRAFWDSSETCHKTLKDFLEGHNLRSPRTLIFSLGIKSLNYQVISLPEKIKEREKKVLLGLEIDKNKFKLCFNYKKLDLTLREEDGILVCDYIVLGLKNGLQEQLQNFAKSINVKNIRAIASFMLFSPSPTESLSATAYIGNEHSEICIWGGSQPLAIAAIPNTGDPLEDLSRFISNYSEQIENLEISNIRLYGPRVPEVGLNYPYQSLPNPNSAIASSLSRAAGQMDLLIKTKLPKPPIAITFRNLSFLFSFLALAGLIVYTSILESNTLRYKHELRRLNHRAERMKQINAQAKKLESQKIEHQGERDFYLKISKRRIPWHLIFFELGDLSPRNLWFERFNASKNNVLIAGKASSPEDVAALSLNLSNSSRYFKDAQVIGMRDYKEGPKTYVEFQLNAKLKSPLEPQVSETKPSQSSPQKIAPSRT